VITDSWAAVSDGARRVSRAPIVLAGVWLLLVACAVEAAFANADALLPRALAWMQHIVTAPIAYDTAVVFASSPATVVAPAAMALVAWWFVAGGAIDRLARDRATRAAGFFVASGVHFFAFLRLGVVEVAAVALLVRITPWHPAALALVAFCGIVADYARVRLVVEDRRSAVGATAAAVGFIARNAGAVALLFALSYGIFWAIDGLFDRALADWPWSRSPLIVVWLAALVWVKLVWLGSETALFQMRLAHAGYVARPEPRWPDSPTVEMIG
jgi:hypothetical protein